MASSPPGRYRPLATGPPLSAPPHPLRRTAGPLSVWTPRGCAAVARRRPQIPVAAQRRRRRCLEYKACPCRTAVTLWGGQQHRHSWRSAGCSAPANSQIESGGGSRSRPSCRTNLAGGTLADFRKSSSLTVHVNHIVPLPDQCADGKNGPFWYSLPALPACKCWLLQSANW